MTYPVLFRRKALSVREGGPCHHTKAAKRLCAGIASVARWIKTPDPKTIRNKPSTKIDMEVLAQDYKKTLRHPRASEEERHIFQEKIEGYEREGRVIVYLH